jgi:glucuronate isomerase
MNVEVVCTTDDPSDSLQSHKQLANSGFTTKVLPTFRPDKVYNFFIHRWLYQLSEYVEFGKRN